MNDSTRNQITKESIDMWESLRQSVEEAGGGFFKDQYMNYTVPELISHLCTNGVRFVYKPKEKQQMNELSEKLNHELCAAFTTIEDLQHKIKDRNLKIAELESKLDYSRKQLTQRCEEVNRCYAIINDKKIEINKLKRTIHEDLTRTVYEDC